MTDNEKLTYLLISARHYAQDKADKRNGLVCLNDEVSYLIDNGTVLIPETGIGDLSDGYHTFNELYHHRAILFSVICNMFDEIAWKSKKHDTGDMYDGMFIVGIDTPEGQATYHYDIDPYWDMFQVKELPNAPKWDGHTPEEAIRRIGTLKMNTVITPPCNVGDTVYQSLNKYETLSGERRVYEHHITEILYSSKRGVRPFIFVTHTGFRFDNCDIGRNIFFTLEAAKRALEKEE